MKGQKRKSSFYYHERLKNLFQVIKLKWLMNSNKEHIIWENAGSTHGRTILIHTIFISCQTPYYYDHIPMRISRLTKKNSI